MGNATRDTPPAIGTSLFLATMLVIVGAIVATLLIDRALARAERAESKSRAAALFVEGSALFANGQARAASERFATALAAERDSLPYAVALARAKLLDSRPAEAERVLLRVLASNGSDGAANRLMGELLQQEGRDDDAKTFYHRAVFGSWRADSVQQRASARLALVELLATHHDSAELLAELLPLEEEFRDSVAVRHRLAQLFVRGGLPQRGAGIYVQLLRRNPRDRDARVGLGQASLELGKFRTARANFLDALNIDATDSATASRLRLVDTVIALNPFDRAADSHQRFVRSGLVAQRTVDAIEPCADNTVAVTALLDSLAVSLHQVVPTRAESEASEQRVRLAGELWLLRPMRCPRVSSDTVLAILHATFAR